MKKIFFYLFLYKKIFYFCFLFFCFLFFCFYLHVLLLCVVLIRVVGTKAKWRVAKSKIVFDAVHGCPAVSAVAADAAAANRFPNVVCECVVEDL